MQVLVEQPYKHVAVLIQKISDQAKQAETRLARAAPQTALSVVDNDLSA
jgi:hypothetical protein